MDSITSDFGEVLLWSFWFFIWFGAIMVWFRCLFDMFGDTTLSGWAKAGWAIVLVFLPWLGALIYLIEAEAPFGNRVRKALAAYEQATGERIDPNDVDGIMNRLVAIDNYKRTDDPSTISPMGVMPAIGSLEKLPSE